MKYRAPLVLFLLALPLLAENQTHHIQSPRDREVLTEEQFQQEVATALSRLDNHLYDVRDAGLTKLQALGPRVLDSKQFLSSEKFGSVEVRIALRELRPKLEERRREIERQYWAENVQEYLAATEALIRAAKKGSLSEVKKAWESKFVTQWSVYEAINGAIEEGHTEVAKYLLDHPKPQLYQQVLSFEEAPGVTREFLVSIPYEESLANALYYANEHNRVEVANHILESLPYGVNERGGSLLVQAIKKGRDDLLAKYLARPDVNVDVYDGELILKAIEKGNFPLALKLIEKGANPNHQVWNLASKVGEKGSVEDLKALMAAGYKPGVTGLKGFSVALAGFGPSSVLREKGIGKMMDFVFQSIPDRSLWLSEFVEAARYPELLPHLDKLSMKVKGIESNDLSDEIFNNADVHEALLSSVARRAMVGLELTHTEISQKLAKKSGLSPLDAATTLADIKGDTEAFWILRKFGGERKPAHVLKKNIEELNIFDPPQEAMSILVEPDDTVPEDLSEEEVDMRKRAIAEMREKENQRIKK